jgi:molybdate transport system ATP-binding protein
MNTGRTAAMRYRLQRAGFTLDVDVSLPLAGITGIFGPSGAGKTTLLRCIAGLERPLTGTLVVAGETWQDEASFRAVQERAIGYVFQEPRLFEHLDVRRNVEYGWRRRGNGNAQDVERIVALLGLEGLLARRASELSGGEAQRVAIARALLRSPELVLMDEPLASLDRARRDEILPFLDRLHAESSVPILYVSHGIDEICRLCDHLLVMDSGRVVADGDLQSVLVRTDLPLLAGEDAGSVIECRVIGYDERDELLRLGTSGGELLVPGRPRESGAPLRLRIRANDVSVCRTRPEASTILNILPAVVDSIQAGAGSSGLVRLALGDARLVARVTRRSIRELALAPGDRVFAQIKSVAMRSRPGR